jgi:formate/nitrite transporter FocA (FNT family)
MLTPVFEKIVTSFQEKFKFSRMWAFFATVFCVNIVGTFTYFGIGAWLMCKILGLPFTWPPVK